MPRKLIIDADPGIGDALAIALALFDPEFDVIGLTPVAGCTSGENASLNLHALVGLLDPPKWPRIGWTEGPPCVSLHMGGPDCQVLNGRSGLGDFESPVAEPHQKHESAKLLIDLVRTYPHEVTLLTLGPLTNLELAQERYPDLLSELHALVILGGATRHGGDVTAAAEFNIFSAPEAARAILNFPATKTLVPLEVTAAVVLTFAQYGRLAIDSYSPLGRLLEQTLPFALRAYHEHLGMEGFPLAEVVALTAAGLPHYFQRQAMAVDVETHGELTRGMTVADRRRRPLTTSNTDVLTEVDPQRVLDYLDHAVRRACP
ncbi:MAG: nucleoside hydrolase [Planctomycetaceae bacterium]|nr:nucleoside hydrolase [Planctomycetaceae bacterium]